MKKRIANLEFAPATYLLPKDQYPKNPSWHINFYYPNSYYKRENDFIKEGDFYRSKEYDFLKIHKDCFKYPESCMAIASFEYQEGSYELHFVEDRPLSLSEEELKIFWELIDYGYKYLNKEDQKNA